MSPRDPSRARWIRPAMLMLIVGGVLGVGTGVTLAAFASITSNSGDNFAAAADFTAPSVSATVIGWTAGSTPGYLRQGATFRVYANVSDTGNPASGVSTVRANVSSIAAGQTTVTLTAGAFSYGGTSYNRRSASFTADAVIAEATYTYSITCTDAAANSGTQAGFTVVIDNTAPTVAATVIAKNAGGIIAYIMQGGTFRVYANLADGVSGAASATANVSTISTGQSAANLSAGSFTVGGVTYGYRSALITADNPLAAGTYSYTITPTDNVGNSAVRSGSSVTVDDTVPAGTAFDTANVSGGTVGHAELGDTVTFTFSEPIDPDSILAGWDGSATNVTVRIANGNPDVLTIRNTANTAQLPFGSVNLARNDYVAALVNFGASGSATPSVMSMSGNVITVTLGTPSAAVGTAAGTANAIWNPATTPTDWAGNRVANTTITQPGPFWAF